MPSSPAGPPQHRNPALEWVKPPVRRRLAHATEKETPMAVEQKLEIDGEVTEALPNLLFRVTLENDHQLLAHLAGKMRRVPPPPRARRQGPGGGSPPHPHPRPPPYLL